MSVTFTLFFGGKRPAITTGRGKKKENPPKVKIKKMLQSPSLETKKKM